MAKVSTVATKKSGSQNGDLDEKKQKTRIHITLDEEVSTYLEKLPVNKSKLVNKLLRWFLFGEEVDFMIVLKEQSPQKVFMEPGGGFEPPKTGSESLNGLWEQYRDRYLEWLSENGITEGTKTRYRNALDRIMSTYTVKLEPKALTKLMQKENHKKNVGNALRSFLNFLADEEILPQNLVDFLKQFVKPKKSQVRQVHITDEELKKAYELVKMTNKDAELIFKLLVFTGLRLSTIVEMLNNYSPSKLQKVNEKVYRYPVADTSKGTKRAFWAYMPAELVKELRQIKVNYNTANHMVYFGKVSPNSIRRWFYTKLILLGVKEGVADFIQGRSAVKIGTRVYLTKTLAADEAYSRVVDELKKVLEG